MKKSILYAGCCLLLWSCQKSVDKLSVQAPPDKLMPKDSINYFITRQIKQMGQFEWRTASDRMLWSAIAQSDHIVSMGYHPSMDDRSSAKDDPGGRSAVREQLLDLVYSLEKKYDPAVERSGLERWPDNILPVVNIRITSFETMRSLRYCSLVRYLEPMNYETLLYSSFTERQSGCAANLPDLSLVAGMDYGVVSPFAKASWNYPHHGLLDAWRVVSGAGISVFLIDTGISYEQENLGSQFNQGLSQKRRLERIVTLPRKQLLGIINVGPPETPEDRCGHGTAMAGVLAAPRGTDGNMVGVAYNVNLISCRAAEDVFIDAAREVRGVSDAFVLAANRSDVRIISMSMGRITVSSQIRDAILLGATPTPSLVPTGPQWQHGVSPQLTSQSNACNKPQPRILVYGLYIARGKIGNRIKQDRAKQYTEPPPLVSHHTPEHAFCTPQSCCSQHQCHEHRRRMGCAQSC